MTETASTRLTVRLTPAMKAHIDTRRGGLSAGGWVKTLIEADMAPAVQPPGTVSDIPVHVPTPADTLTPAMPVTAPLVTVHRHRPGALVATTWDRGRQIKTYSCAGAGCAHTIQR